MILAWLNLLEEWDDCSSKIELITQKLAQEMESPPRGGHVDSCCDIVVKEELCFPNCF